MRPLLSVKMLYRSAIKTLLTFILLAAVTFAFFSQTAEYAVTAREFNSAAKQYSGVGSAEVAPEEELDTVLPFYINADPRMKLTYTDEELENYIKTLRYQPLTQAQISAISALPYVTSADTRYMTAGISDTYFRLDDGKYFYNFTVRCIVEGTLMGVNPMEELCYTDLTLKNCTILAGNPPWEVGQTPLMILAWSFKPQPGRTIALGADRNVIILNPDFKYDIDYIHENMSIGNRYVFVFRFEPLDLFYKTSVLGDYLSNPWCDAIWPIDGVPRNYLETDKFAPLRALIEITNADLHTFDMVYLDDMSAILRFGRGDMAIVDGRALNKADSADKANVCVVSFDFAKANSLKVGDSVTMKLGTQLFEQYKNLGALAVTPERYAPPEKTATLEIVGIYADTDGPNKQSEEPNWSYSINTIFVPKSLLPVPADKLAGHLFTPSEFSFKVDNAWDIPAFLKESAPMLTEMGLTLVFDDDGWLDIAKGFQSAKQLSLIKIAVLSAAVVASTGFVVYLFIGRKKKEYAVMRALGTTKKVSARSLLLPLMAVTGVSVLAGSAAAWIYTVKTIAHSNAFSLLKAYAVSADLPAGAVLGCILGEILLTLVIALVLLRRIGARTPLSLLQGNGAIGARSMKKAIREKQAGTETKLPIPADLSVTLSAMHTPAFTSSTMSTPTDTTAPIDTVAPNNTSVPSAAASIDTARESREQAQAGRKGSAFGFILRCIWKHARRSAGKSVLASLLAALLFVGVGQLALMKHSYARLCTDTVVKANFVGGLMLVDVPEIIDSGFIKNPYYEFRLPADVNFSTSEVVVTNNIARYTGEEVSITYAEGFDASIMDQFGDIIIAGKALMDQLGLKPGGTVQIIPQRYIEKMQPLIAALYRDAHPHEVFSDEELLPLIQENITKAVNRVVHTYTIAGVVSTPSGKYNQMVFMPGFEGLSMNLTNAIRLDVAEFTLADNFRADEFRSFGEKTASDSFAEGVAFMMDTSKLENLRNTLRLLETLYPITVTAALLIGGFLCCLVIVQSSKEAAIMRVLGTTKRKTRTMLALEQLLLGITGLAVGALGLLAYKGAALAVISKQLYLFIALYFAVILVSAVICAGLATRRNVLQLLQTKE